MFSKTSQAAPGQADGAERERLQRLADQHLADARRSTKFAPSPTPKGKS